MFKFLNRTKTIYNPLSNLKTRTLLYQRSKLFCKKIQPDELNDQPNYSKIDKSEFSEEFSGSDTEDPNEFYRERKRLYFLMGCSAAVVVGVYFGLNFVKPDENTVTSEKRLGEVTYIGKAKIGGPWELIDFNGNSVTHQNFSGKYYLIYFGFTQCPDVCPLTLKKLSSALKSIKESPEYKYFDLDLLFISIDPDRDSLERIKSYCHIFNKDIIGLTGLSNDDKNLKDMLKTFKIHSSKIYLSSEDEEEDRKSLEKFAPEVLENMQSKDAKNKQKNYSMDHTIVTYLINSENKFLTYLSSNLNQKEIQNIVSDEILNDLESRLKKLPKSK